MNYPFYYSDGDFIHLSEWNKFGRVDEKNTIEIVVSQFYSEVRPEYSVSLSSKPTNLKNLSKYSDKFHRSNKKDFLEALEVAKEYLSEIEEELEND